MHPSEPKKLFSTQSIHCPPTKTPQSSGKPKHMQNLRKTNMTSPARFTWLSWRFWLLLN